MLPLLIILTVGLIAEGIHEHRKINRKIRNINPS